MNKSDYEELLKYCKSRTQKERVLACIAYESQTLAGDALGVNPKRINETIAGLKKQSTKKDKNIRVGIIGDTHLPYELDRYLDWIQGIFQKQKVNKIIHIGDLFDHHALSFHDSEPALKGSHGEYIDALEHLEPWKEVFPELTLITGNHDLIPARQLNKLGVNPLKWMRPLSEVYEFPSGWSEVQDLEVDGVLYHHGHTSVGVNGFRNDAKNRMQNTVSGHAHGNLGISWTACHHRAVWGMAVGCGIDNKKMAFTYGKHFKNKPIVGCGVVRDSGKTPLVFAMDLGEN